MLKHVAAVASLAILAGCASMPPELEQATIINRAVNSQIIYQTDVEQYGVSDRWVVNPVSGKGDCEDYALTKVDRLKSQGIASRVAVCMKREGPHAVALVDVAGETYALDNLRQWPYRKADSGCVWWAPEYINSLKTVHKGK